MIMMFINLQILNNKSLEKSVLLKSHFKLWDILTMCVIDGMKGFYIYDNDVYKLTNKRLKEMMIQEKLSEKVIVKFVDDEIYYIIKNVNQKNPIIDILWLDCWKSKLFNF